MQMSTQQLRIFQQGEHGTGTPAYMQLRRALIFVTTVVLTVAGCYEMYEVVQVGGVTILEWMVLVLFVTLFAWIAFSFSSALAGFAVLFFSSKDPLGIDPHAPLPPIASRNSMLLPTYNEDPYRIMARLRAMQTIAIRRTSVREMDALRAWQVKFPVTAYKFPVLQNIFPVNLRREFRKKSLQHSGFVQRNWPLRAQNCEIPC